MCANERLWYHSESTYVRFECVETNKRNINCLLFGRIAENRRNKCVSSSTSWPHSTVLRIQIRADQCVFCLRTTTRCTYTCAYRYVSFLFFASNKSSACVFFSPCHKPSTQLNAYYWQNWTTTWKRRKQILFVPRRIEATPTKLICN